MYPPSARESLSRLKATADCNWARGVSSSGVGARLGHGLGFFGTRRAWEPERVPLQLQAGVVYGSLALVRHREWNLVSLWLSRQVAFRHCESRPGSIIYHALRCDASSDGEQGQCRLRQQRTPRLFHGIPNRRWPATRNLRGCRSRGNCKERGRARRNGGGWWRKDKKVVKTKVEGARGPRGSRGGDDQQMKTTGDFCGECWSCGGCHRSSRCEIRWKRQLANAVRRLLQVGKGDLWIATEVQGMMGQVRRQKQPGPAAVEVVELPRPRPKEGGGEQASVHAIAEERRPKTKTGQATTRGGMAKEA